MNRPIRIGLIAEGEAELGASVPYIKPEEGGQVIEPEREGALHRLIRREFARMGLPDCAFIHRHPTFQERGIKLRTGHSILEKKYLQQVVIAWQPEEVDMIVLLVDADDQQDQRHQHLDRALKTIRENHLDANDSVIPDCSAGGLAIRNFETWLLADTATVAMILEVEIAPLSDLENLANSKAILESAIADSSYLSADTSNQRPLQIRWQLAEQINLDVLATQCPIGYATFIQSTVIAAKRVIELRSDDAS